MNRNLPELGMFLFLVTLSSAGTDDGAGLDDSEFFQRFILPKAQEFATKPGLPFTNGLSTNLIINWKINHRDDGERVVARMPLTNRMGMDFLIRGTNVVVFYFADSRLNAYSIAGDDNPDQARFYSKLPNQFTLETAREFASVFLQAAGHKPENFRLSMSWQLAWGDPKDKVNYIPLPFYQFDWLRKDVKEVKPGEIHHPRVRILVSGINRQVLRYERAFLPIPGDFQDAERP